jgi:putative ABC transport system permease protein
MPLKHLVRRLVRFPAFTSIAVLTLAIGIGANTAIFSVVNGILIKPLQYPESDRLVAINHSAPGVNIQNAGAAPFLYFTYLDHARSFSGIGLWRGDNDTITGLGDPEEIRTVDLNEGVLPALGVKPLLGRLFSKEDDAPGSAETMILSHGYWQRRFGGDPSVIGRRVMLDGRPREVIGVLPASFRFLNREASAFVPMHFDRAKVFLGSFSYQGIARLAPGVTVEQATAEMTRLIPVAIDSFPPFPGFSLQLFKDARLTATPQTLKQDIVGDIGRVLWILMGTIGMVLLIACANVANLLLVRTDGRQQELAIRAALGAGWGRIAHELMTESLALGALGGVAGLALAYGGLKVLTAIAPANLPRLQDITIDAPVLLFTFVISLLAGALFGIFPVVKYAGPHLNNALRAGGRTLSQSRERHRARNTLVVAQVALALVLLVGSGLMIRTFQAMKRVQPGFASPADLLTLRIYIPKIAIADPVEAIRAQQNIAERIASVSGVSSVGLASDLPMDNSNWTDLVFVDGTTYPEGTLPPLRHFKMISPGLLKTLGTQVIAGRDFSWEDLYGKQRVALVSENLARELWGEPSAALGRRVRPTMKAPWREVVGVVSDVRDDGFDKKAPTAVYWPMLMDTFDGDEVYAQRNSWYVIRSSRAGTSAFVNEVSRAIWSVNPDLPVGSVRTMQEVADKSMARTSFTLVMLLIAGAMALLLGVAGLYGVISYAVSQRSREIGIRMALGAQRNEVTRMFVGQGLRLAAIGIAIGLVAAVALTRLIATLLFDVSPVDPLTYAGVSLGLASAAVLASYVPALRAATLDPCEALRAE